MNRFPLSYNEIDIQGLSDVLDAYKGRDHQEIIHDFELQLGKLVGSPHVAAVQSGTAALHLALQCVGVKPGDFVIAPTFAYVASISPIVYLKAQPVLIDSEELTWNMDPVLVEAALKKLSSEEKHVGAIIVVHNYGVPAQLDRLVALSKQWNVPLIEDAAESFGSTYFGKWTGTIGAVGVYSFNNNKTVTGFGGGALVSGNNELIAKAKYLASHARSNVPYYQHDEIGYNYRISPLSAAYVMAQMARIVSLLARRKTVYHVYRKLGDQVGLRFQPIQDGSEVQPWLAACILPGEASPKEAVIRLGNARIEVRRLWNPLHRQPAFSPFLFFAKEVSISLFDHGICLPMTIDGESTNQATRSVLDILLTP